MTAPAAAPALSAHIPHGPHAAPKPPPDRFAFASLLDSLPAAVAAKTTRPAAGEEARTPKEPPQGEPRTSGQPALVDSALLSSLRLALPAMAPNIEGGDAAAGGPAPEPTPNKGAPAETLTAPLSPKAEPAETAAKLTAERAFHVVSSAGLAPSADIEPADVPEAAPLRPTASPAPALPTFAASGKAAVLPPLVASRPATEGGAKAVPDAETPVAQAGPGAERMAPADAAASLGSAAAAAAPAAPTVTHSSARPPPPTQDLARNGRKADAAASPAPRAAAVRAPATVAASSVAAKQDVKADGPPSDTVARDGQSASLAAGSVAATAAAFAPAAPVFDPSGSSAVQPAVAPRANVPRPVQIPAPAPVREIDVDLSPSGLEEVSMTMRLAGDKLSVVIRAASSQTTGSIEAARDAIADRLAAIGQPLDTLVVRQTGSNADANITGNSASTHDGATANDRPSGGSSGGQGSANDARQSRRGAHRHSGF